MLERDGGLQPFERAAFGLRLLFLVEHLLQPLLAAPTLLHLADGSG